MTTFLTLRKEKEEIRLRFRDFMSRLIWPFLFRLAVDLPARRVLSDSISVGLKPYAAGCELHWYCHGRQLPASRSTSAFAFNMAPVTRSNDDTLALFDVSPGTIVIRGIH